MAHVDRYEQHLVEREKDRDLQKDRPASGERVDLFLLVEVERLFLLALRIVLVEFFDARHFRLQLLHLRHAGVLLVGNRIERGLHEHGQDQNGHAEVVHQPVDPLHQLEQRTRDEIEPAPVDHAVELLDAERLFVTVDQRRLLRAGIKMTFDALARVGRYHERTAQVIGLEGILLGVIPRLHRRIHGAVRLFLIGNEGSCPIFVGDAEPSARHVFDGFGHAGLDGVGVGHFLKARGAGHAKQAFVQNVESLRLRRAVAVHTRIGQKRNLGIGLVFNFIDNLEHVVLVDRERAPEHETLAVVPCDRRRRIGRKRVALFNSPQSVAIRHLDVGATLGNPTEFGEVGFGCACGRQQVNFVAVGVGGLAVFRQHEVIDAAAFERDRAFERRCQNLQPRRSLECVLA